MKCPPTSPETTADSAATSVPIESLGPMAPFYSLTGRKPPVFRSIAAERIPQPYRALLVHRRDMTGTLAEHHRQVIDLRVIEKRLLGDELLRRVVLTRANDGVIVEYGASRTQLGVLGGEARGAILQGRTPLGAVLTRLKVAFVSQPSAYFEVAADDMIRQALGLTGDAMLYGRCNSLTTADGREISAVVEILPPAPAIADGVTP